MKVYIVSMMMKGQCLTKGVFTNVNDAIKRVDSVRKEFPKSVIWWSRHEVEGLQDESKCEETKRTTLV